MVSLRPLHEDEFNAWDEAQRAEYEQQLVAFAGLTPEAARAKTEHDVTSVLPDGLTSPDVWVWAVEHDGRRVGTVFVGIRREGAWLYDITISEDERGRGYGRAAMLALEDAVRALGHESIGLNVWGGNETARGLYRSLGYVEQSVQMRKQL